MTRSKSVSQELLAGGERGAVDVGEDDEPASLVQPGERLGRIRERRPASDGRAEALAFGGRGRRAEAGRDAIEHDAEHVGIPHRRVLLFDARLDAAEGGQQLLSPGGDAVAIGPRNELGSDAGLPVDQRPVAVEAEGAVAAVIRHGAAVSQAS